MSQTKQQKLIDTAITFLYLDPEPTPFFPIICKHPFTDSMIVSGPKTGILDLEKEQDMETWRTMMKDMLLRTQDFSSLTHFISKSYLFAWLKFTSEFLEPDDYASFFIESWSMVEQPSRDGNLSIRKLVQLMKKAQKSGQMQDYLEKDLAGLQFPLVVYRGTSPKEKTPGGLSWTTSLEMAQWFADRFDQGGRVFQTRIQREDILFSRVHTDEKEIVCDPKHLTEVVEL